MDLQYLKQRVVELFTYLSYLKESANEDTKKANELIIKIKEVTTDEDSLELVKQFKKLQFFNNLKLGEMEKTMPTIIELVSIAQVIGIELNLNEEEETIIKMNKTRTTPMYIVDKSQLIFNHPELEAAVEKELDNPSETDLEALKKLIKVISKHE